MNKNPAAAESGNVQSGPDAYWQFLQHAKHPNDAERPERCRAVIFNETGTHVLGIGRNRTDREAYVVFPGGGLEDADATPKDGVWRELQEELGLGAESIYLGDEVVEFEGQYFYAGYATQELGDLVIGGPESQRSADESGVYSPGWFPVGSLVDLNCFPAEVSGLVDEITSAR
jgi:8-oxo-dGTP pyrophosphatase MutT (NUDIX family)